MSDSPRIIRFEIQGVPQQKRSPRLTRIKTKFGERAAAIPDGRNTVNKQSIIWLIRQAGWSANEPIHCGPVALEIVSWFTVPDSWPRKRREEMEETNAMINMPDADRLANMVMDSAKGIIYKDDSQIYDLHSIKYHTELQTHADVTITLYPCQYHVLKTGKKKIRRGGEL